MLSSALPHLLLHCRIVFGGAPSIEAAIVATPSPVIVQCRPGFLKVVFAGYVRDSSISPTCSTAGAIAANTIKKIALMLNSGAVKLGRANQAAGDGGKSNDAVY